MAKKDPPLPKIAQRRSGIEGWGVFAAEDIQKNARIIDYAGELIHNSESEEREDRYSKEGQVWVFRVNRNWSRDANVDGNIARFINHSCEPNCETEIEDGHIYIKAIKPIAPDAEQDEVRIQGAVRTNAKGERLVTLFLVNDQREPETNRDSAWLFQPELSVKGSGEAAGTPVFLRRPSNDVVVDDADLPLLEMIAVGGDVCPPELVARWAL